MAVLEVGSHRCYCKRDRHTTKLVVLTGGPGAGVLFNAITAKRRIETNANPPPSADAVAAIDLVR